MSKKTTLTATPKHRFWNVKTALLTFTVCVLAVATVAAFTTRAVVLFPQYYTVEEHYQYVVGKDALTAPHLSVEVHSTIRQYRWVDGDKHLIYTYSHPGVTTIIGENLTAAKLLGEGFATANYTANVTFLSMGHNVGLTNASVQLPGEWNRSTSITPEIIGAGHWNLSYSFYPSGSGTTNSTGWNWASSGPGNLWAYDTFATITYTSNDQIDVEAEVEITYQT